MPRKEHYWKNPEKHRRRERERAQVLIDLGYKSGRKKISSYLRMQAGSKLWQKNNLKSHMKASTKHMNKVRAITGIGGNELARFRLKLMGGMRGYKKGLQQVHRRKDSGQML